VLKDGIIALVFYLEDCILENLATILAQYIGNDITYTTHSISIWLNNVSKINIKEKISLLDHLITNDSNSHITLNRNSINNETEAIVSNYNELLKVLNTIPHIYQEKSHNLWHFERNHIHIKFTIEQPYIIVKNNKKHETI